MTNPLAWHPCILLCRDGTYYTGITNNLDQRFKEHNRGKGCRYTKYRCPVRLVYSDSHPDRGIALKREAQIQGWSRRKQNTAYQYSRASRIEHKRMFLNRYSTESFAVYSKDRP
jgi:putative endonuclease